jgi:hypothetical protein
MINSFENQSRFFSYDIVNQFIDSFVDEMAAVHNKLQIPEPPNESYPEVDLRM